MQCGGHPPGQRILRLALDGPELSPRDDRRYDTRELIPTVQSAVGLKYGVKQIGHPNLLARWQRLSCARPRPLPSGVQMQRRLAGLLGMRPMGTPYAQGVNVR